MLHPRPTYPIESPCIIPIYIKKQKVDKNKCILLYMFKFRLDSAGMLVQWVYTGMSVSDEACWSPMGHVGLRWGMSVSDEACLSLLGL